MKRVYYSIFGLLMAFAGTYLPTTAAEKKNEWIRSLQLDGQNTGT